MSSLRQNRFIFSELHGTGAAKAGLPRSPFRGDGEQYLLDFSKNEDIYNLASKGEIGV
jgi:hypothetical protein